MPDLQFIAPTKRRKMTQPRATKIFLQRNGICHNCGKQIRDGQEWFVEHPVPVAQGGSDKDEDLWPAHLKCKAEKDATDAATKAKRDRAVTRGWKRPSARRSALAGPEIKYSRARGCFVNKTTGEPVESEET